LAIDGPSSSAQDFVAYPLAPPDVELSTTLDASFADAERLPRSFRLTFEQGVDPSGMATSTTYVDGTQVGDMLTDGCSEADGYRFHDCLHLAFATVLGWSPVCRMLLNRKRRSSMSTDATEDGGRAIVVEEGVAALVFAHEAAGSLFYAGFDLWSTGAFDRVNPIVLESAAIMTAPFEVRDRTRAQWACAIVTGLRAMTLAAHSGEAEICYDADLRTMSVRSKRGPRFASVSPRRT
jgi:hypothetical protein